MPSSGLLRRVALVRTDVSEGRNASIVRVRRIGELGTTLAVTSNRRILRRKIKCIIIIIIIISSISIYSQRVSVASYG
jgi:hypothetical protein